MEPARARGGTDRTPAEEWRRLREVVSKPYTWFGGIAGTIFLMVWTGDLTPARSNLTLTFAVLAMSACVASLPKIGEGRRLARVAVFLSCFLLLETIAYRAFWKVPPPTRTQVLADLDALRRTQSWGPLLAKLEDLESDTSLRDAVLFYRGTAYSASAAVAPGTVPDPERYLSQVPRESEFYEQAQVQQVCNFKGKACEEVQSRAHAIADRMAEGGVRNTTYYILRALGNCKMTAEEASALYGDFTRQYSPFFDSSEMRTKTNINLFKGLPVKLDLLDKSFAVPGCAVVLLFQQAKAAHNECLPDRKREAMARFDKLSQNERDLAFSLGINCVADDVLQRMEELRRLPFPGYCDRPSTALPVAPPRASDVSGGGKTPR